MLYKSQVYTSASGSVGGLTYARNRFGAYTRGRAVPVNPNSTRQQTARAFLAEFATAWASLTDAQRASWEAWAAIVTKTNKLGDQIFLTGFNWFVAINSQRAQAGITATLTVPSGTLSLSTLTPPTVLVIVAGSEAEVSFEDTDEWANDDLGFLNVQISDPQPKTRNYFNGPFYLRSSILGDSVTPPTSPATVTLPYGVLTNQRVFFRFVGQTGDGRPTAVVVASDVAG